MTKKMTKKKTEKKAIGITNCQFYGVKWDAPALETVQTVAKALLNLTELFRSQNINIETMIKVDELD